MKELWVKFYEMRLDEGMTKDQADEDCADHFANLADYANMMREDKELDKWLEDLR